MMYKIRVIAYEQEEMNLKELLNILSTDLFLCIANNKCLKVSQLNSIISLLIKKGIQFTLSFTPATSTEEAYAKLTIYAKPGISLSLEITFDSGDMFGLF